MMLILEARAMGIEKDEVRKFLRQGIEQFLKGENKLTSTSSG
ncbi:DNA-binding anti-repressor SinI [bacterium LRH843]|nr:DNA-binding anti-repressor SinI [bacterium LRH843]